MDVKALKRLAKKAAAQDIRQRKAAKAETAKMFEDYCDPAGARIVEALAAEGWALIGIYAGRPGLSRAEDTRFGIPTRLIPSDHWVGERPSALGCQVEGPWKEAGVLEGRTLRSSPDGEVRSIRVGSAGTEYPNIGYFIRRAPPD